MRRKSPMVVAALLSGCQETRLRERTLLLSSSVNDLYYRQVLNNLAMMHASPGSMPYFSTPIQGTNQNQNAVTAMYTPGWDFITAKGFYIARWLQDKTTAAFGASTQNAETWQTNPTTNPDKISLLKAAYLRTMGEKSEQIEAVFAEFAKEYHTPFRQDYLDALTPGWYEVGCKRDVPKHACYVGHCGDVYVWVRPENLGRLSEFTLAIMDIVTVVAKPGGTVFRPNPLKTAAKNLKTLIAVHAQREFTDTDPSNDQAARDRVRNDPGCFAALNQLPADVSRGVDVALGWSDLNLINYLLDSIPDSVPVTTKGLLTPRETLFPYPPAPVVPAVP